MKLRFKSRHSRETGNDSIDKELYHNSLLPCILGQPVKPRPLIRSLGITGLAAIVRLTNYTSGLQLCNIS